MTVRHKGPYDKERLEELISSTASPLLTLTQAARMLNVHVSTLRRWSNLGLIKTYRIGPRADRRFKADDVKEVLEMPIRESHDRH